MISGEHVGDRSNKASWTESLWVFILSQEAEIDPDPWTPSLPEESRLQGGCDPKTLEVDQSSKLLDTCPTRGELAGRECSDHWDSRESWTPRSTDKGNKSTGGTSSSQRQLEHLTPEITRWQNANIRILLTETKTTQHHQNPVLPWQWVLVPQHTQKVRFKFKIISHDAGTSILRRALIIHLKKYRTLLNRKKPLKRKHKKIPKGITGKHC